MEKDEELKKAFRRVKTADHVRLAALFPSLFIVLFLFYGNKFLAEAVWFGNCQAVLYNVLFFAVLIMLGASVVKILLAASYNRLLKKKKG